MSYRDVMKERLEIDRDICIDKVIEEVYTRALEESKKTGQSVESITYEVLEGLEEGYTKKTEMLEEVLKRAILVISKVIHQSAMENILKKDERIHLAKLQLENSIEEEQMRLKDSLDTFKHYAEDKSYKTFKVYLEEIESEIEEMVNLLENKMQYNHTINLQKGKDAYEHSLS